MTCALRNPVARRSPRRPATPPHLPYSSRVLRVAGQADDDRQVRRLRRRTAAARRRASTTQRRTQSRIRALHRPVTATSIYASGTLNRCPESRLRQPHRPPVAPLPAHQQQDEPEHDRHVPEVALLRSSSRRGRSSARPRQRRELPTPCRTGRRSPSAMRRSRAAFMPASKYSASPGAARSCVDAGAERRCRRASPRRAPCRAPRPARRTCRDTGRCARRSTAAARRPCPSGPSTCATTRASLISTNVGSTTSAVSVTVSPGLDAVGAGVRLDVIGHAVHQPAQQLAPVVLVGHVLDRRCRRASATATSPGPGTRSPCRGRSAGRPARPARGGARRCRSAASSRPA